MNQLKHFMVVVSAALAASLLLATVAYAEERDNDVNWGVFPDQCTFEVEHSGHVTIIGPEDYTLKSESNPQDFAGESNAADDKAAEVDTPVWVAGYIHDSSGFDYPEIDVDSYADEIFRLANEERIKAGLSEVERWEDVDPVAAIRAQELWEKFSHTRPNGEGYMNLMDEYGIDYEWAGENAAMVAATASPATMMNVWMNSEGHKKNILNPKHTGLGIGVYQVGQMVYCSQMFVY